MHTLLLKIASFFATPILILAHLLNPVPTQVPTITPSPYVQEQAVGAALPQATAVFETSLAAPISATATSMTLTANAVRGGGSVAGYTCFTVDEGNPQAEVMCGTVASTAVTGITRGISYADGISSVTANMFQHRRGANIKITDFPLVQILKAQNNGEQTFPNPVSYAPGIGPVGSNDLTDKEYVLSVVSGGTISTDKIVVTGIAGETVAAGNLLYLKVADGRWWKTSASTASTVQGVQFGIAQGAGTAGNLITSGILIRGVDVNNTGTAGAYAYASNTSGTIASSAGTTPKVVGQYVPSSAGLYFDPQFYYNLTSDQKDALAGNSGTPSASNRFVTEAGQVAVTNVQTFTGGGVFTVTVASPGVFTLANHGFSIGTPVTFSTTGALPTGLTVGTTYYVISAGFTTSAFEVSTTLGGSAVNTTGTQSGVHTAGFAWTKATGAKVVQVIAVGGGGGGAGGGGGSTGPGAGGGGGAATVQTFNASDIGSSETVFAGIPGAGGGQNAAGSNGTASTFGSRLIAGGGGGGGTAQGLGGGGGSMVASAVTATGGTPTVSASAIGAQSATGTNNLGRSSEWGGASGGGGASTATGGSSLFAGAGGGAGGGVGGGGAASAGGTVGTYTIGGGGTAGTGGSNGGAGSANSVLKKGYGGAGGGGGGGTSGGGIGGAGGFPGGGGGGGGDSASTGGAGGIGGAGQVIVITYF